MSDTGWKFRVVSEFCGVGPDGRVRAADLASGVGHWRVERGACRLSTPRNGWLSVRAVVEGQGEFSVSARADRPVTVDLYREFYHKQADREEWLSDALVPVRSGARQTLPDPDNAVPGQTAQSFWVDVFVPADTSPGVHSVNLVLRAGGGRHTIRLAVEVLPFAYPDEDCVVVDYNSYGGTFLENQYPRTAGRRKPGPAKTAALIGLIHKYHAMVFEHHGLYHQLGFSHSGATAPLFAPGLSGDGRNRHVSDWSIFDRHYGPLLDGSAFAGCRRKALPVYSIYTAFNPDWPADYLGFGQPGYRTELVNVLRDFDRHFREKGWTDTVVEYFFNHKKRHRYFEWDGDEPRYVRDDARFRLYREYLDEATKGSPVKWKFRMDASWMQKEHWTSLAGVIDFWVNGGFVMMFEKEVHAGPMARGDITWSYSGGATMRDATADMAQVPYKIWIRDFTGNVLWLTTGLGKDPWFASDGGPTALLYPGERFGVAGPIPCVRMKILRNAVQDVNLLDSAAKRIGKDRIKADLVPTIPVELWHEPTEGVRRLPPCEWTGSTLQRPFEPDQAKLQKLDPLWWEPVRKYAHQHAGEVNHA